MFVYVLVSNNETVQVFSSVEKLVEDLKEFLEEPEPFQISDYTETTLQQLENGEYDLPLGASMHIEGGVTFVWKVEVDK